jgi:capsule biosynthesis phosphatase
MLIVLAGGLGVRMAQGTFPKPLTPILGKPMISFALGQIAHALDEILFIYGAHLRAFNFEETVLNCFKKSRCRFVCVDFNTRGPVDTALAGLFTPGGAAADISDDEPLVFVDNDNVYPAQLAGALRSGTAFLGYDVDKTGSSAFCFLKLSTTGEGEGGSAVDGTVSPTPTPVVTAIVEKQRVSDTYGTGVYAFASKAQFVHWARHTLQHGPRAKGEVYMSGVFANMIAAGVAVRAVHVPVIPVGTAELADAYCASSSSSSSPAASIAGGAGGSKLRICFDLDNTLVTYPVVPNDYSTVRPIHAMIDVARKAKAEGHTVIIYTARRMETHKHNGAAALADIGRVTFATLDKFNIPCDEIVFGKPIAHIYVDDRAVNPYFQTVRALGFAWQPAPGKPAVPNRVAPVRGNAVWLEGTDRVVKRGTAARCGPEADFYAHALIALPDGDSGARGRALFPAFFGAKEVGGAGEGQQWMELTTELVKGGVPLSTLLSKRLLEPYHVTMVSDALRLLHGPRTGAGENVGSAAAAASAGVAAVKALAARGVLTGIAAAADLLGETAARLEARAAGGPVSSPARVLHGNSFLSNVLVTGDNVLRLIAPRGRGLRAVTGEAPGWSAPHSPVMTPSFAGDAAEDFARVAASLLGVEEARLGMTGAHPLPAEYRLLLVRELATGLKVAGVDRGLVFYLACVAVADEAAHASALVDIEATGEGAASSPSSPQTRLHGLLGELLWPTVPVMAACIDELLRE